MAPSFVNRNDELARLRRAYDSDAAEFVVVLGRRRIGKSALVRQSLSDDGTVYYQATQDTRPVQISDFVEEAKSSYPGVERIRGDWEALLGYLGEQDATIVIDEWPHLVEADSSVPSTFQRLWDTELQHTKTTLVLIGSSISIMTNKITERDAPLYNRDTLRLDLSPLSLGDAAPYYPASADDPVEILESWSVFGGTPFYIQILSSDESLATNVNRHIVDQHGRLHGEPETLLRAESVRKPERYTSILRALADGKRETSEIAEYAGFDDSGSLWQYMERLKQLRLVEEDQPVTEETSRPKRYRLREPLFKFWYRFLYGKTPRHMTADDPFTEYIRPEFPPYVGRIFEDVCRDALPVLFPDASFSRIGGWWDSRGELDVVGLDHSGRLFGGEAKFTSEPMNHGHLNDVEERTNRIDWTPPREQHVQRHHCLFSRSGFTESLEETAENRSDVHLFSVGDVVTALTER
jgi:hypothetical protein